MHGMKGPIQYLFMKCWGERGLSIFKNRFWKVAGFLSLVLRILLFSSVKFVLLLIHTSSI